MPLRTSTHTTNATQNAHPLPALCQAAQSATQSARQSGAARSDTQSGTVSARAGVDMAIATGMSPDAPLAKPDTTMLDSTSSEAPESRVSTLQTHL